MKVFRFFPLLVLISTLGAQDRAPVEPRALPAPDQEMEPVKPAVEKIGDTLYRIEDVTLDQKTREIRFPAKVNMQVGLLEFLIVHENGKVHESLLMTKTTATNINLALKLLRYKASRELYFVPDEYGGLSEKRYEVPDDVKAAARVRIDVEWKDGDRVRRVPANEWVLHAVKESPMPSSPWIYGGSEFYKGRFVPDMTGDYVAIFITNSSLMNYSGDDNTDDTVWTVHPTRVPAEGTNVTVVIAPYNDKPAPSKP